MYPSIHPPNPSQCYRFNRQPITSSIHPSTKSTSVSIQSPIYNFIHPSIHPSQCYPFYHQPITSSIHPSVSVLSIQSPTYNFIHPSTKSTSVLSIQSLTYNFIHPSIHPSMNRRLSVTDCLQHGRVWFAGDPCADGRRGGRVYARHEVLQLQARQALLQDRQLSRGQHGSSQRDA